MIDRRFGMDELGDGSHLVSLRDVRELRLTGSGYVVLTGDRELPVSRRHTRELKDRLIRATKAEWARS